MLVASNSPALMVLPETSFGVAEFHFSLESMLEVKLIT
jgi:hypothetical protein